MDQRAIMHFRDKYRRTGRTTRRVDASIQELFANGEVLVYDHHGTDRAHEHMATIVRNRMMYEHNIKTAKQWRIDRTQVIRTRYLWLTIEKH